MKIVKKITTILFIFFYITVNSFSEKNIELGIDRIDEYLHLFNGARVGLITNSTGYDSKGRSTIEVLQKKTNLVLLFSPEHGINASKKEGQNIGHSVHSSSNLKVYSLYGNQKKPTKQMLENIDVLCFDIQDVGSRFYTYISTMAYAMMACKEEGKKFVVFDRPNPISGDAVEGFILDANFSSFVGLYPIAQRHGMTVGELALMFNSEFGISCNLEIVPIKNWQRSLYFEDLKLTWHPTSPNIPTVETCLLYSGMCLFEGCNVSVGRGTTMPFKYLGSPFINGDELANSLNLAKLDGVQFFPCHFLPSSSLYSGEECEGIYIVVLDKKQFRPVRTALAIFQTLKKMYPKEFKINNSNLKRCGLNLLFGNDFLSKEKIDYPKLLEDMKKSENTFLALRQKYLLY